MSTYRWKMSGAAADGQTWETAGTINLRPGQFRLIFDLVWDEAFQQLTKGAAVYGEPGKGCRGPYDIRHFSIEKADEPR